MVGVLIVVALLALALLAGLTGADSRPGGGARPEPQWPFYRHRS